MPPFTPVQLAEAILQLQLLDGEPRDRLLALAASHRDARELAQDLLRRDWLTAYQINQLFLGRGADLAFGPYVYLERLGEGGMGQVFKARQRSLGRVVALKVIRRECLSNAKVIKRFEREMQALGQMRHPNIVHAFDADHVDGVCYIAMEYIDGIDLARLVKQSGPLPVTQACDYIRQAALGLGHAAEQGLVHRDIKPANLFLTRPGETRASAIMARAKETGVQPRPSGLASRPVSQASGVVPLPASDLPWGLIKILDMGLARWTDVDNDRTRLTQLGAVMGTPDYIAPEQTRNSSACDIRADLYSLGCTFYFLLSGQPPFPNGTLTERLLHHQLDQAEPVDEARRRRLLDPDWVKGAWAAFVGRDARPGSRVGDPAGADGEEARGPLPDARRVGGRWRSSSRSALRRPGAEATKARRPSPGIAAADPSSRQGKPPAVGPSAGLLCRGTACRRAGSGTQRGDGDPAARPALAGSGVARRRSYLRHAARRHEHALSAGQPAALEAERGGCGGARPRRAANQGAGEQRGRRRAAPGDCRLSGGAF
ncbi:MAG: protein kinase [Gemmataceae bacterium]